MEDPADDAAANTITKFDPSKRYSSARRACGLTRAESNLTVRTTYCAFAVRSPRRAGNNFCAL